MQQKKSAAPHGYGKNVPNVVADDYDDWDREDSPKGSTSNGVNQREQNGMVFFNRAPLNAAPAASQKPGQGR